MTRLIGAVLSLRMATLHELATIYSLEDCYDMVEVGTVDAHNSHALRGKAKPQ